MTTPTIISIDNHDVPIHIDVNGNLYFEINNALFQLNVDRNDDPCMEQGNYEIIPDSELLITKGKIIKSEKFVDDKYFPEDNGHTLVDDTQQSSEEFSESYDDSYFSFYETGCHMDIHSRENGQVLALYDVFLYDDSDTCNHPQLVFQTKLQHENAIYRVALYTSGKFYFRPIGCFMEKKYELSIVDNAIICKRK